MQKRFLSLPLLFSAISITGCTQDIVDPAVSYKTFESVTYDSLGTLEIMLKDNNSLNINILQNGIINNLTNDSCIVTTLSFILDKDSTEFIEQSYITYTKDNTYYFNTYTFENTTLDANNLFSANPDLFVGDFIKISPDDDQYVFIDQFNQLFGFSNSKYPLDKTDQGFAISLNESESIMLVKDFLDLAFDNLDLFFDMSEIISSEAIYQLKDKYESINNFTWKLIPIVSDIETEYKYTIEEDYHQQNIGLHFSTTLLEQGFTFNLTSNFSETDASEIVVPELEIALPELVITVPELEIALPKKVQ
ncbi:MAG: hypothetical protein ATN31_05835 [Candidatus Epulonipiscioides saccharophilum]|nr:MAG: hypothetical protein ATN31_05835 [Epulopiscium sp. AS2M-Bin001]